ncbi:MAG: ABC transporter substrate-binding protein [Armatimonadota bacterium]
MLRRLIRPRNLGGLIGACIVALSFQPLSALPVQPRQGGTLTVSMLSHAVGSLDPRDARHTQAYLYGKHIFDPLARIDVKTGKPGPALAKSWIVSPDGRSITYVLRDDVVFHDGTPFNAEAVKFNFDRFAERGARARTWMGGDDYVGAEVVDRTTVRVTWRQPQGFWWERLSYYLGFNSPTAVRQAGRDYGTKVVVGTGPFKFVSYTEDTETTLERFPQYRWGSPIYKHSGPAYVERLIFRKIEESNTRMAALERGEVQFIDGRNLEHAVEGMKTRRGFAVYMDGKAGTTRAVHLNVTRAPLDDLRVRQAIAMAINREALVKAPRYSGVAQVAYGNISGKNWYPAKIEEFRAHSYLYNPAKAKQLLEEAGWKAGGDGIRAKDGKRLEIQAVIPNQFLPEIQPVQAMLAEIGVDVKIRIVDVATWFDLMVRRQMDVTIRSRSGWGLNYGIEDFQCQFPENASAFCNPELEQIIARLYTTLDTDKKRELVRRAQRLILVSAAAVPVVDEVYPWMMRDTVRDVYYPVDSWPRFYDAWTNR